MGESSVPLLEKTVRRYKRKVGRSWRLDKTYVKIKGRWWYLYRAVDSCGWFVDFLLTAKRDREAAVSYLKKAIRNNTEPTSITIDKSGANKAAVNKYNDDTSKIEIRQNKYLNNLIEQDHRVVKRKARQMLWFKTWKSAKITIAGVEIASIIRKGQCSLVELFSFGSVDQWHHLAN